MESKHTQDVASHYTMMHELRQSVFGNRKFANYGYWARPGMSSDEASEELTDLVARTAGVQAGSQVLDVGCGYGANAVAYAKRYKPGKVIGIDITDIRIQAGRDYVKENHLSDVIELRVGDACKLDFADASFDHVIAVECAFHFDPRRDFLREAGRVLRSGGTIAMSDMIPRRGVDPASYLTGHIRVGTGLCLENAGNAYDADVYTTYLRESGFTDIRIESITEKTTVPYYQQMEKMAAQMTASGQPEKGNALHAGATNLKRYVDGGEDYVLVYAKKA